MELIDDALKPYHIATLKKQLGKAWLNMFVITFMSSASKGIQRQGTRATIRVFGPGLSNTKLKPRKKPMMIISGVFRSQETLKATGQ